MLQIFTILVAVISLFESSYSAKTRALLIVKVDSDYNRQYFSKVAVMLTPDRTAINADVVISHNISGPIWFKVAIDLKLPKMTEYRTVFRYEIEGCDLLEKFKKEKTNLIFVWMSSFMKSNNLPRSCPVLPATYKWQNFKIDSKGLASFAMEGNYKGNFLLYFKKPKLNEMVTNFTTHAVLKVK